MKAVSRCEPKEKRIGCCRLVCGDAYAFLDRIDRSRYNVCACDPPYGIGWDTRYRRMTFNKKNGKGIDWLTIAGDERPFDPTPFLEFEHVVLWGGNHFAQRLPPGSMLVWIKRRPFQFGKILGDAEIAWTNRGRGVYCFNHEWNGAVRASERGQHLHPTQKPVVLMKWMLERLRGVRGVFDPFMGSGPIAAACHELGIPYLGVEIHRPYFDAACNRLRKPAVKIEGGGQTREACLFVAA